MCIDRPCYRPSPDRPYPHAGVSGAFQFQRRVAYPEFQPESVLDRLLDSIGVAPAAAIAILRTVIAARSAELHAQVRDIVSNLLRDDRKLVQSRIAALWRDAAGQPVEESAQQPSETLCLLRRLPPGTKIRA